MTTVATVSRPARGSGPESPTRPRTDRAVVSLKSREQSPPEPGEARGSVLGRPFPTGLSPHPGIAPSLLVSG